VHLGRAGKLNDLRGTMSLLLEIISANKEILGSDCVREFREDGGTIGRSLQNDWILPDPDQFISGKHATIDYKAGAYYLMDVSTNGVFVNQEEEPIGKDNPRRLFDGDLLRMGEYEFRVTLDEGESLSMPPPEPMTVVPDHVERLVSEDSVKTGIDLLGEEEMTGDEEFESALFGSAVVEKEKEKEKKSNGQMNDQENPFVPPSKEEANRVGLENLLDAFMKGLDISRADIHASTDPLVVMENAGKVLKEFVDGTSDLLTRRGGVKAMFRLDQTTVMPKQNNPLKLAENTRDSMMQLLIGKEGEYLSPVDAVREVCKDLKIHQSAVIEAMMSAFVEYIGRFNPEALQENFDRTLDSKPLFRAKNQLKYWQLYCDLYPIMTEQSVGTLPHQFAEDFVRAYEKHITQAERLERQGKKPQAQPVQEKSPVSFDGEELVDQTEDRPYGEDF
jgi:predicted component of type VI protein secretion system